MYSWESYSCSKKRSRLFSPGPQSFRCFLAGMKNNNGVQVEAYDLKDKKCWFETGSSAVERNGT